MQTGVTSDNLSLHIMHGKVDYVAYLLRWLPLC